jgi:hypothetical protein
VLLALGSGMLRLSPPHSGGMAGRSYPQIHTNLRCSSSSQRATLDTWLSGVSSDLASSTDWPAVFKDLHLHVSAMANDSEEKADSAEGPHGSIPYSVFAPWQKKCIMVLAASAGWFSGINTFIHFPLLPFLAQAVDVSTKQINLSVTVYLVVSGLAPTFVGSIADRFGRRLVSIAMLMVFLALNIGLALQIQFGALLALRAVRSAVISGTYSAAYGVLGDLCAPAERGGCSGVMTFLYALLSARRPVPSVQPPG